MSFHNLPRTMTREQFKARHQAYRELKERQYRENDWTLFFRPRDFYTWENFDAYLRFDDIAQSLYL